MTEQIKYIPARLKSAVKGGHVTGAEDIDAGDGKTQQQVNNEAIQDYAALAQRVADLEAMEQIVIDGGEAQIATGSDFTNPDTTKRAKIPTVGAVIDGINDGIYDVSLRFPAGGPNSDGKYTLEYILNNANTLIPTSRRHSGMSISFVQSSDNKYVQYRLMANEWSADTDDWAIADEGVYIENPEFVEVHTDAENKVLYGVKTDGDFHFGAGVPKQVQEEIDVKVSKKVDKVEGKKLSTNDYDNTAKAIVDTNEFIENPEWLSVVTDNEGKILRGRKQDGTVVENCDVIFHEALFTTDNPYIKGAFSENMTMEEIIELHNSKIDNFADLCRCNALSFYPLSTNDTEDVLIWKINHNFRNDIVWMGISKKQLVSQLNKYFAIPIYRFQNAKMGNPNVYELGNRNKVNKSRFLNYYNRHPEYVNMEEYPSYSFLCMYDCRNVPPMTDGVLANQWKIVDRNNSYSLWQENHTYHAPFSFGTEPSALLLNNGTKMRVYSANGMFAETEDGINWGNVTDITDRTILGGHPSVNMVDGLFMWIGANSQTPDEGALTLCTSDDGITFTYRGKLKGTQCGTDDIGNGHTFKYLGNSYLFKDYDGTYYLFYEGLENNNPEHPDWEICLMTCTDLFVDNGDGTIGNWVQCDENPIIPSLTAGAEGNYYPGWTGPGNPEIVKGEDNQPLKYDGKYYMYFHTASDQDNTRYTVNTRIERAYSYDLVHWVREGSIIGSRDIPEYGDNSDHCLCQFKGRTYLFYTTGINSHQHAWDNIRCVIDDRTLIEMLKIKP